MKTTKFEYKVDAKLRALGERRRIRTLICTLAWWAAIVGVWIWFTITSERSFIDVTTLVVIGLLAIPFWGFKAHRTLFGRSYYADVKDMRYAQRVKNFGGMGTRRDFVNAEVEVAVVTLRTDEGETVKMEFSESNVMADSIYYKVGDRVMKVNGLRFPLKCGADPQARLLCPKCAGIVKPGTSRCGYCRTEW